MGHLQRAEGKVPHPKGEIAVSLIRNGEGLSGKIVLPPGVTGTFVWKGRSTALNPGEQLLRIP